MKNSRQTLYNAKLVRWALLILLPCLLLSACTTGGKEEKPQLSNTYQDDAIIVCIKAADKLNLYNYRKHTLKVVLVQVKDIQDVQPYLTSPEGIAKILDGKVGEQEGKGDSKGDNKGIYIQPFIVKPGAKRLYKFTRMAGAKKVLVVAGYYDLIPNQVVRTFEIPVFKHWKPIEFWEINRRMGRMAIFLHFGSKGIAYAESKAKENSDKDVQESL